MCLSFSTSLPALRNVPQRAGQERTGGWEALSEAAMSTRGAAAKPSPTHPTLRGTREKSSKLKISLPRQGLLLLSCPFDPPHPFHSAYSISLLGKGLSKKHREPATSACGWHRDKRGSQDRIDGTRTRGVTPPIRSLHTPLPVHGHPALS